MDLERGGGFRPVLPMTRPTTNYQPGRPTARGLRFPRTVRGVTTCTSSRSAERSGARNWCSTHRTENSPSTGRRMVDFSCITRSIPRRTAIFGLSNGPETAGRSVSSRNFARTEERGGQFIPDGGVGLVAQREAPEQIEAAWLEGVVQSFPEPGPRWSVSTGGGMYPRWSSDGSEIYFMTPDSMLMAVPVAGGSESVGERNGRSREVGRYRCSKCTWGATARRHLSDLRTQWRRTVGFSYQ